MSRTDMVQCQKPRSIPGQICSSGGSRTNHRPETMQTVVCLSNCGFDTDRTTKSEQCWNRGTE
eukprot:15811401-Heterocapsa_arctica.AAC.1